MCGPQKWLLLLLLVLASELDFSRFHTASVWLVAMDARTSDTSDTKTFLAAAWQHEAAAAIQRQIRGWRANSGMGQPTFGWCSQLLQAKTAAPHAHACIAVAVRRVLSRGLARGSAPPSLLPSRFCRRTVT